MSLRDRKLHGEMAHVDESIERAFTASNTPTATETLARLRRAESALVKALTASAWLLRNDFVVATT